MKQGLTIALMVMLTAVTCLWHQNRRLKAERDTYRTNSHTLLADVEAYRVRDSLNAARVGELTLTLKELKRYRQDDLALIEELRGKGRDLTATAGTATESKTEVVTTVRDTIIRRDTTLVPVKCIDVVRKWSEVHGCVEDGVFYGHITHRDSLVLVESVKRKRFLGFMWKTKRVKDRRYDIVSKNPDTRIVGIECIKVEK